MALPITASGYADWDDYNQAHDTGSIVVTLDDPPAGLDTDADCPVCDRPVYQHDALTIDRASGEIFRCVYRLPSDWQDLPEEPTSYL